MRNMGRLIEMEILQSMCYREKYIRRKYYLVHGFVLNFNI